MKKKEKASFACSLKRRNEKKKKLAGSSFYFMYVVEKKKDRFVRKRENWEYYNQGHYIFLPFFSLFLLANQNAKKGVYA